MSTDSATVTMTGKNVTNISLKEFFSLPIFKELEEAFANTPTACKACCWENVCGGGEIVNRFSKANRFNNPSVFCEGLKILYQEIFACLVKSGVKVEELKQRLVA